MLLVQSCFFSFPHCHWTVVVDFFLAFTIISLKILLQGLLSIGIRPLSAAFALSCIVTTESFLVVLKFDQVSDLFLSNFPKCG